MRKRLFGPLLAIAACAAVLWMYFTPHIALRRIQAAAERGDSRELAELVDFPALRNSVKDEIRGAVSRSVSSDPGNPFGAVGGMIAGALAGPVVETVVTPSGIAALTHGQRPSEDGETTDDGNWRENVRIDRGYEGMNRFVVTYREPDSRDERVSLVLTREGLGWKLTGVRFGEAE